jgi:hypothetical protein
MAKSENNDVAALANGVNMASASQRETLANWQPKISKAAAAARKSAILAAEKARHLANRRSYQRKWQWRINGKYRRLM